ncbi:hypothetical protein Droror1_Dr00001855 [Drosera rotundifolia]
MPVSQEGLAPPDLKRSIKVADKEEEAMGNIISDEDLFLNDGEAGSVPSRCENNEFHRSEFYSSWTVEPPSNSLKHVLKHCTGWQQIPGLQDTPDACFFLVTTRSLNRNS